MNNVIPDKQTTALPGYGKKSFLLYYNGGEIWFEHLECLSDREDLVIEKLRGDVPFFVRPSSTSFICFVYFETVITDNIVFAVKKTISESNKHFTKIAFCGLSRKDKRKFKKELSDKGFEIGFFDGLEDAKIWLLP